MPKKKFITNKILIIDAASEKIIFKVIVNNKIYTNDHKNSRENFDRFSTLLFKFLARKRIDLKKIKYVIINMGPGKFSSIRTSISTIKALKLIYNFDIYGFSSRDLNNLNYSKVLDLFKRRKLIKNLIKPLYLS